jgi:poly-gamma-glutamate synthesis protein (capsule biosynthesis protein)
VASIHWGSNWEVSDEQRRFAHQLIDGGVTLVHGHSSHHPRPIEVYRDRLILYGCGDLLNDYEGIRGYEEFASPALLYLADLGGDGRLLGLRMIPMRIRRMRLERATRNEATWLAQRLTAVSGYLGTRLELDADGSLTLRWRSDRLAGL